MSWVVHAEHRVLLWGATASVTVRETESVPVRRVHAGRPVGADFPFMLYEARRDLESVL